MKSNLSVDSIKNNLIKKYKSSTDIQTISNKKSSTTKKNINDSKSVYFICNHKSNFISFCQICSLDLCPLCEKKHINHKIIKFNDILPKKEEINSLNKKIEEYTVVYNKLIEEIYDWKKELDKKIFYFEEQIKNNTNVMKNIEFIQNFDFSKNNNYSSLIKYKRIYELISEPEKSSDINSDVEIELGCYLYQNYMNSKQTLEKIVEYKNNDFLFKSEEILKLIQSFLSKRRLKSKYKLNDESKTLSPINLGKYDSQNYFYNENAYNNNKYAYTYSNIYTKTCTKESDVNKNNKTYFNNDEYITTNDNDSKNNTNQEKTQMMQKIENQSKSIGNIFLDGKKEAKDLVPHDGTDNNYNKVKKSIIKSSTLRRLNIISPKNDCDFQRKDVVFNKKKKNESNSVNFLNPRLNKKLNGNAYIKEKRNDITNSTINNNNNGMIINKFIPKIKKQHRVYKINSIISNNSVNNNLNTINSYNNISADKKKVYKHKKLNSMSISNYINQSLPIDYNSNFHTNTDFDNTTILNNTTCNYTNLIKPLNIDSIKNPYNINKEKNDHAYDSNINPFYSLNTVEANTSPSLFYSLKDGNTFIINKRNDIKKKLLTKNAMNKTNFNTILETPITFSSKLNSESQTLKYNKSNNNLTEYHVNKINFNEEDNDNNKYIIDSNKDLYVGLELGNSECKIGIVNQNNYNDIELFNFNPDNEEDMYSIPSMISFDNKSNEIKIGVDAKNNLLSNPSQTIFNILKIIGKSYQQINNDIDLWPFKLYYNEDLCRPYVKISYNKQKNRIFFFEDLLSIYLKKLLEIFFTKIELINEENNLINLVLVVTVPNSYNYLQRKIIEKIFQTQIFPQNNEISIGDNITYENKQNNNFNIGSGGQNSDNHKDKKKSFLYSGYKIVLKDIKIENASNVAPLCLFSSKYKYKFDKYDINKTSLNIDNNEEELISGNISEFNKDYFSMSQVNKESNKQNINNKKILVINIEGGFTNVSLAHSYQSQNKPKDKSNHNSSKSKNDKNIKKNNLNILEINEVSGIEYGEEDLIDSYINDCLKQLDENIYKECLKSPTDLARIRQSILVTKQYFNSSKKDESVSINIPHKYLDIKIMINQSNYEKSCQEIYSKIISLIKNLLKKSKISEKNIDLIILIASPSTTNKMVTLLKKIFSNSKFIHNNCNNYIAIGATFQALNNNMIKPLYKFIDITNMNFGIETLNGIMDIIVPKGLKIPVQKMKYVKIRNGDNAGENTNHLNKYLEINIFEGDNRYVKNNRLISCANIDKRNFKEEKIGNGFIELLVEFEINSCSNLSVYVLDIKTFKRRFECLTNLDMVKG